MQDLKTYGVYRFTLSDGGAKPELLISIKNNIKGSHFMKRGFSASLTHITKKNTPTCFAM